MPQCAIAQLGSAFATSRNCCSDALYANECSSATPRLNAAPTPDEHEVLKSTLPSFSGMGWECSSATAPDRAQLRITARENNGARIEPSYC